MLQMIHNFDGLLGFRVSEAVVVGALVIGNVRGFYYSMSYVSMHTFYY